MTTMVVNVRGSIATITMNNICHLNALTREDYDMFATSLREIDKRQDVLVTVWQGTGTWFSAGTDVQARNRDDSTEAPSIRDILRERIVHTNLDCSQALSSHSKILVAALNGPVMGISAAFLGYFDFIYAMPNVWLSVPFTFLGIIAEGGSSVTFARRMGIAKANEVLIWGKKKNADELLACGFLNQILPQQSTESFHLAVQDLLRAELEGLDPAALLIVKGLIRTGLHSGNPDAVTLRESYAQAARFATGLPSKQFRRIARKEIKHKL